MSHDQRPGKMRVVQDASAANRARKGDSAASAAAGVAARTGANVVVTGGAGTTRAAGSGVGKASAKGLPMLQAGIFLLACVIGGVVVAILRPF